MKVLDQAQGKDWIFYNGDSCEILKGIPSNSLHYSIFSPPFASLYTYSNSDRDLGNCKKVSEFYDHFSFIVSELYRVIMPGRLLSFHCMNLPTTKTFHGYIGIDDFRGDLIKIFQRAGFIFASEVCIWKDPVIAMQRTKALGLLHKQLKKDSCMSRQGIPDYLITMRKPGENSEPVVHTNESFPVAKWQEYASPIWCVPLDCNEIGYQERINFFDAWFDINPSDTLQRESAREDRDEKHICPLQLEVIERALELWTNPGDRILTPFGGIGSEGYKAIQMGRKAVLMELKNSYYGQGVINLKRAELEAQNTGLFEGII